jgi:hypothetical protein
MEAAVRKYASLGELGSAEVKSAVFHPSSHQHLCSHARDRSNIAAAMGRVGPVDNINAVLRAS